MTDQNKQKHTVSNIENVIKLNLNDILNKYISIKKKYQPKLSYYEILSIVKYSPIVISGLIALFKTKITTIFFYIICIPILFGLFSVFIRYFKKRFLNIFYINTDFGKCKVRLKREKNNSAIRIYFYKTIQSFKIKRKFLFSFFPSLNYKYTRMLIIKDTTSRINNIIEWMKDVDEEFFSLYTFIKDGKLDVEYINLEEKSMHKININTANITQLSQLSFIGKIEAIKIANHIQKNGEFESIWDFAKFIDLPQHKYKTIYKYITVIKTKKDLPVIEQIRQDMPQFDNTLDIL